MINKIEKINELNTLLNDGTISKDEFEFLKKELFSSEIHLEIDDKDKLISKKNNFNKSNSEKIILKSFHNSENKLIDTPNIEYLDFTDIDKDDEKLLKSFIRLKHIHAPIEMTGDEKKILEKLFSHLEIEHINSERDGYNFPLFSIGSVLSVVFAIFLINVSPCMMYLGGISLTGNSIVMSLYVLTRVSATKRDKTTSAIAVILIVFTFIFFGITWKESMGN